MNFIFRSKLFLLSFCFTLFLPIVKAQNYALRHYDANDGLPSSDVFHTIQDTKGYIWFATDNGVSRFNGYEFTNYDISDGLAKNTILEIFEDYKGRIWFISITAELSYFENGKIYPFKYNHLLVEEIKIKPVPLKSSFFVDSLDNIYMGIEGSGIISVSATGDIKKLGQDKKRPFINQIYEYPNKKLLVSYYYHYKKDTFLYSKKKAVIPLTFPNFEFETLKHCYATKLNDHKMFVSGGKIIYEINNYFNVKRITNTFAIHWMSKDKENNIWVCGRNIGAWRYNKGVFKKQPDLKLLEGFNVSSVIQDNKQGYWFTTLHNGVYYLPSLNVFYDNRSSGLVKDNINTAYKFNDTLWIGYHSNFLTFKTGNQIKNLKLFEKSATEVTKIFYDTINQQTVVGTSFNLHFIKSGKVTGIKNNHKKIPPDDNHYYNIKDIVSDNKGGYWIGGGNGFYHWYNGQTDFSSHLDKNFRLRVNSLIFDYDNTLWLGTINGLWNYKNNYLQYLGRTNDLFKLRVLDIVKYQNNTVIGTKGGGILIIQPDTIIQITKKDGLSSNTITSMAVSDKYLWAGTKNGLNRINFIEGNKYEPKISKFTKAHGLLTNEIRQIYLFDTTLLISTNDGLIHFNINSIKTDTLELPVYFKEVFINNKNVPVKNSYNLSYNENNISVRFEGISFKNQNNILYKYMMKGVDTTWTFTKNRNLRFSFLPPGNYDLLISAMNPDEVWNSNPLKMSFNIKTPFWKTSVFIIFISLVFISLVYLLFKYRLNEIKKKTVLENELNKYINQALVNQMNPHFLFNALNSINNYILKNDKTEASKYLTKFSGLIRLILENSQKEYITIYEEIKASKLYLDIESTRLKNSLKYEFIIEETIDQFSTKIPSLLIQPFLENAIWHGIQPLDKKGEITVTISKKELFLQIEVRDNGIGREKSMEINNNNKFKKHSLGIEISWKRIKVLEQLYPKEVNIEYEDIFDKDIAAGTLVRICIPIIA
ncbi:MAG: histidine kinase [Bacteroidota bacterium]